MRRVCVLALAFGLLACEGEPLVPLVQLGGVAPKQIELGDKLEIDGTGFPQGRTARVVFEGALHRPAELADSTEIEARGDVVAPDRIELAVTDELLAAFCGAGSSAAHTTFDGSITVVFAAQTPGAPPVAGSLQHANIDVEPTAAGQARYLADAEDGDKLARAAGLHVESRPAGGLVVTGVEPASRAASAGLLPDDVIVSANGVRALGVADLAPPAGLASLPLAVRRGGGPEETHALATGGARLETPTRFALPAAIVAAIAALLALLAASPGRSVLWLRRRLARARTPSPAAARFARGVGLVTAAALPLFMPAADASVLALVLFTSALAVALLVSSPRKVLGVASRIVPAVIALGFALVVAGSLRSDELTAAQGALPWGFFALRSPAHLVLGLVFCAFGGRRDAAGDGPPLRRAAELFLGSLHAALAVVVFFGGWRLPLASHHGALALVATAVFVVKVGLVTAGIERVRAALPARTLGETVRTSWLRLVPLAIVAGAGAAAWERHVTSRGVAAATTFALATLAGAAALQLAWPRPAPRVHVDPMS
ncbi:MAG TPA: PDZ domain-containing protein [Polyangiaceae bacterium]|jgi:hypothetical protein